MRIESSMAMLALLLSLLSLSLLYAETAQNQSSNLALGAFLSTNASATYSPAPSCQFAFGFYPASKDFTVCIRIVGIPNNTVMWTANGDDLLMSSSKTLLSNSSILPRIGGREAPVTDHVSVAGASYVCMHDNGYTVLYDAELNITWQNFISPTGASVAEQRLVEINNTLFSLFSKTNHSIGRFEIVEQDDGNLLLYLTGTTNKSIDVYWSLHLSPEGRNVSLKINDDGQFYLLNSTSFNKKNQTGTVEWSGKFIYRGTIDANSVPRRDSQKRSIKTKPSKKILVVGIVLIISALVVLFAFSGYLISRRRIFMPAKIPASYNAPTFIEEMTLRSFTYAELVRLTDNFREELGRGSFGKVYKGILPSRIGRAVAVKRLEIFAKEREKEFEAEIKAIGRTHHRNLVRLWGFCIQGSKRLLVYEYMSNGSLADLLFKSKTCLDWTARVRIALDVARGIHYLHEECDTHVVHCDIKPQNILIDESGTAKVSDFGLAKLLMLDQTRTFTGIRGTRGYVAPEWFRGVPVTVKADVYSYGIVLLELACCRKHVEMGAAESEVILLDWAYHCLERGELHKLALDQEADKAMLETMVKVGLLCTQEEPASRPTMKDVILMLEGTVNTPTPPSPFSYTSF